MTDQELIEQLATEFRANSARRNQGRTLPTRQPVGPLNIAPLPPEVADAMDAAIHDAFEQVEDESMVGDERSDS